MTMVVVMMMTVMVIIMAMKIEFSCLFIYMITQQPKAIYKVSTSKRRNQANEQTHEHKQKIKDKTRQLASFRH
jgi:hypothetical protein